MGPRLSFLLPRSLPHSLLLGLLGFVGNHRQMFPSMNCLLEDKNSNSVCNHARDLRTVFCSQIAL